MTKEELDKYVDGWEECDHCGLIPVIAGKGLHRNCHVCDKELYALFCELKGKCPRH